MALLTLSLAVFPSNCQSDLQGTFEMLQQKKRKENANSHQGHKLNYLKHIFVRRWQYRLRYAWL